MVLIFDLDDTLYSEASFVSSGLKAVGSYAAEYWGLDEVRSFEELELILNREGRGFVFDIWLESKSILTKSRVRECISVYRRHTPKVSLFSEADRMFRQLPVGVRKYLVTDGNKLVQANKVSALGLWDTFAGVYITHRFGLAAAKPSTYCFQKIREKERASWDQMLYVGDNPLKDFVSLRPLGMHTVRVRTGQHKDAKVPARLDAEHSIASLDGFLELLAAIGLNRADRKVQPPRVSEDIEGGKAGL